MLRATSTKEALALRNRCYGNECETVAMCHSRFAVVCRLPADQRMNLALGLECYWLGLIGVAHRFIREELSSSFSGISMCSNPFRFRFEFSVC